MPKEESRLSFNVDNVRVCKILGSGVLNSTSLRGMVFRREVEGTVSSVRDAKVTSSAQCVFVHNSISHPSICSVQNIWSGSGAMMALIYVRLLKKRRRITS